MCKGEQKMNIRRAEKKDIPRLIEDALVSESTKQGLHIYVTLCFDK